PRAWRALGANQPPSMTVSVHFTELGYCCEAGRIRIVAEQLAVSRRSGQKRSGGVPGQRRGGGSTVIPEIRPEVDGGSRDRRREVPGVAQPLAAPKRRRGRRDPRRLARRERRTTARPGAARG